MNGERVLRTTSPTGQDQLPSISVPEEQIADSRWSAPWAALLDFQCERTRRLMREGAPLVHQLPGRMGWEIRLTVQGGLRILEQIQRARGDVFRHRPRLRSADWLVMASRALFMQESTSIASQNSTANGTANDS